MIRESAQGMSGPASRRALRAKLFGCLAGLGVGVFTAGCSFVELKPEAQAVGVLKTVAEAEAEQCRMLSEIRAKTTARIGLISRNKTTVAVELERLARNQAAQAGGNTIVPLEPVSAEGERRYANFLCPH